jgi:hypothetical protein
MVERVVERYYNDLKKGTITGLKCSKCGAYTFPPKPTCMKCGSFKMNFVKMSGKGVLNVYSVINFPGGEFQAIAPYAYGSVLLKEGPAINAMINGVDIKDPEAGNKKCPINVMASVKKVGTKRVLVFKPVK